MLFRRDVSAVIAERKPNSLMIEAYAYVAVISENTPNCSAPRDLAIRILDKNEIPVSANLEPLRLSKPIA